MLQMDKINYDWGLVNKIGKGYNSWCTIAFKNGILYVVKKDFEIFSELSDLNLSIRLWSHLLKSSFR